jgi:hypothetical protein
MIRTLVFVRPGPAYLNSQGRCHKSLQEFRRLETRTARRTECIGMMKQLDLLPLNASPTKIYSVCVTDK